MDKMKAMIEDAVKMRDRYREMLDTIENDEDDSSSDLDKRAEIAKIKSAIRPLEDFIALYMQKN